MNFLVFFLFGLYAFSTLIAGIRIYSWANPKDQSPINRATLIGEYFLLGSILIVGQMLTLALLGLYRGPWLWAIVVSNIGFLFSTSVRSKLSLAFERPRSLDFPTLVFGTLLIIFIFRNLFFLVDVDSHSSYLFAQKLWLEQGTFLVGNAATDIRIFAPMFNAVPYALGLSIFPQETLFPQLVVAGWTVVAALLLYGYTSFQLNTWYGLAAVMFMLFDGHIFFSGANACCIINSALIALIFAAAFNFWEARKTGENARLLLALIYLSQFLANKYQTLYVLVGMGLLGIMIQPKPLLTLRRILSNPKSILMLCASTMILSFWFLRSWLVTGCPTFPIFAAEFNALNWTQEMQNVFMVIFGKLSFGELIKYASYFFIWPGVAAAKYIFLSLLILPAVILWSASHSKSTAEEMSHLGYWLILSLLVVLGIAFAQFIDPRVYRYGIAVLAFAFIIVVDFIFTRAFTLNNKTIPILFLIVLALPAGRIILADGGSSKWPTVADNLAVLTNRLHFTQVRDRYFPDNRIAEASLLIEPKKFNQVAYDTGVAGVNKLSAFLLPTMPQIGLWHTTVVRWESYKDEALIVDDLKQAGIHSILRVQNEKLTFLSPEDYAREAINYQRRPEKIFYNYGFPEELSRVKY